MTRFALALITTMLLSSPASGQEEWPPTWLSGVWSIESRTVTLEGLPPPFEVSKPLAYIFEPERQLICQEHRGHSLGLKAATKKGETYYTLFSRPTGKRPLWRAIVTKKPQSVELTTILEMPNDFGTLKIVSILKPMPREAAGKLAYRLATYGDGAPSTASAAKILDRWAFEKR